MLTGHFPFEEKIVESVNRPYIGLEDYRRNGLILLKTPGIEGENIHGYWLLPDNAIVIARTFVEKSNQLGLCTDQYRENLDLFTFRIQDLKGRVESASLKLGLKGRNVVITFPAEAYVAYTFGLNVSSVLMKGEETSISGKELEYIENRLRSGEISYVMTSLYASTLPVGERARQIARDTGGKLIIVRVMSFGEVRTYSEMLIYNLGLVTGILEAETQEVSLKSENSSSLTLYMILTLGYLILVLVNMWWWYHARVRG